MKSPDQPTPDAPAASAPSTPKGRSTRTGVVLALGLICILVGVFGLYGIGQRGGKHTAHVGACAGSLDLAQTIDPLARGELAALTLAMQPNPLGAIAFDDGNGIKTTIDSFKGRTILLNLWATWCVPCRQEMPALDRLQAALGSKAFAVIPVNIDQLKLDKPRAFLREIGATHLPFYSDSSADILQAIKGKGLPTTVLIGADGCEIGTMAGPAQWDSPEAKALIEALAKGQASQT
jgi:thiol-disulfide isomerase/thioredoxin